MQRIYSLFFILVMILVVAGCNGKSAAKKRNSEEVATTGTLYELDTTKILTRGNRSFIPLDFSGPTSDYAEDVLDILREFECSRNVTIVSWKLATGPTDKVGVDIDGVWVDHKPVMILDR